MPDQNPSQSSRPLTASDAHAQAMRIKDAKRERRERLGLEHPVARMAECDEHGLHGERETCFDCERPVRRPIYVRAWVCAVLVALAFVAGAVAL
jgi:hypothetical protein